MAKQEWDKYKGSGLQQWKGSGEERQIPNTE